MGLFQRLFGSRTSARHAAQQSRHPHGLRSESETWDRRPDWMVDGVKTVLYDGHEDLEVVGESHYQSALVTFVQLSGGDMQQGVRVDCLVILVAEPQNPWDSRAVAVRLDGAKVGYLSREDAALLQLGVMRLYREAGPVALNGTIVGGGVRGDGIGMLGVFLRYDPADFGLTTSVSEQTPATIRTGLSVAIATDAADESYNLSWLDHLDESVTRRIPQLRQLSVTEHEPISRHFVLSMLEEDLYRSRDLSPDLLAEYDSICRQHDSEMDVMRPALYNKFRCVPLLDTYRQMAVRQQKSHDYSQALWWAQRGLELYGDDAGQDEWVDDLQSRAARYWNKVHSETQARPKTGTPGQTSSPETETLVCGICGRSWQRPRARGRKPHQCPDCRETRRPMPRD